MNKTLLRSLLIGACCAAPLAAVAGGVDVAPCCNPPRVDIPDMREGWGFYVEGAAVRAYNNDLSFAMFQSTNDGVVLSRDVVQVQPDYNFDLRVGVDYTLADSANLLKLNYEHLFNSDQSKTDYDIYNNAYSSSVKVKLDAVSLVSEQHILIGPYWEATFTGGVRYARVEQEFSNSYAGQQYNTNANTGLPVAAGVLLLSGYTSTMQFNGVGPVGGVGSMFHLTENLALGAEGQVALLIGRDKLSLSSDNDNALDVPVATGVAVNTNDETSLVPELEGRVYGNYFYRFVDGMELQVELGWRFDQYLNLKTRYADDIVARAALGRTEYSTPAVISDDIGFSGPYLAAHLKI